MSLEIQKNISKHTLHISKLIKDEIKAKLIYKIVDTNNFEMELNALHKAINDNDWQDKVTIFHDIDEDSEPIPSEYIAIIINEIQDDLIDELTSLTHAY